MKSLASGLLLMLLAGPVLAEDVYRAHGIAMHGAPRYGADFEHFEYANPDAPKGGHVRLAASGSFDSFNPFIPKGIPAAGITQIYDTLLVNSSDEPFTMYGQLAREIELPEDRAWVRFHLHPEARFHDGEAVTAHDVVFTFNTLIEKGKPFFRAYYGNVREVSAIDDHTVQFDFHPGDNRELALIVGQMQILPQHYWKDRDFNTANLEAPLGSGPYRVKSSDAGRSVTYERVADYWGRDLPVNKGQYNFDQLTYDYYRDETVALEAFKAGEFDFRPENNSKLWATGYTGPAVEKGLIRKELIDHDNPTGMQGYAYNTRRDLFSDARVRHALAHAFDFEWTNRNLFYDQYTRTESYFSNSELASSGLPDAAELELLEPLRDQVPPEVFTQTYQAPRTDGSGNIRENLATAARLLREAGWEIKNGVLTRASDGKPFQFEMLMYDSSFQRVAHPFIQNLKKLGIEVEQRMVDITQYITRLREFDFDLIVYSFPQSNSPGNEQRIFWGSEFADRPDSRNVIGIRNPAIDQLVERVIAARTREELVTATHALDRVLLWNHYVIPQWHIRSHRIAFWDRFARPAIAPRQELGFMTWWVDAERDAALQTARRNLSAKAPAAAPGSAADAQQPAQTNSPAGEKNPMLTLVGILALLVAVGFFLRRRKAV